MMNSFLQSLVLVAVIGGAYCVPDGFDFVFGPISAATSAPGYMGFVSMPTYDVPTCAAFCKSRDPDAVGGACQFINIWTPLVNGTADTVTCSMYSRPTDASTATNVGSGSLTISESSGYVRTSLDPDGGFESWQCLAGSSPPQCSTSTTSTWTASGASVILHTTPGPHTGGSFARLISGNPDESAKGGLTPAAALDTTVGDTYVITFYERTNTITSPGTLTLTVTWNGNPVFAVAGNTAFDWRYHTITVTAAGSDVLAFETDSTTYSELDIDDIYVLIA